MDIGNLSSTYNDIYTSASNAAAAKMEKNLKTDYSKATDDELMDACKQFEAYFLEQVFKEMMKTVPKSELSSGSSSTMMDYFKDEMIKEVAADSTEQNSLGLAQMLYEQMKRNYNSVDPSTLRAASEKAATDAAAETVDMRDQIK